MARRGPAALSEVDARWLRRCLALARRAEGRTAPNPIVGCVIVDARGRVLSEGWHRRAGEPHAEAMALARLGRRSARGATLYVSLEPCNHHGRTPPCAPAVLAAGVGRVVIGALDPIPGHAGGARWLRARGVAVDVAAGALAAACEDSNAPFFTHARRGRPYVVLKAGVSLDGRIATRTGESRWITGAAARADAHRLRDRLDAVVVGVGTVLADDPQLTVRGVRGGRDPVRVVLDSRLRTPPAAKVLAAGARVIVACTAAAPAARRRALEARGAEVWVAPGRGRRVDLAWLCRRLGEAGVRSVLVEGGGAVHAGFVEAGLVDEVRLYVAPIVLGGAAAPSWIEGDGVARLVNAARLRFDGAPRRLGDDLALRARRA